MFALPLLVIVSCGGGGASEDLDACAITVPEPGTLRAEGTILVDEHDRRVLLRGVNAGGRSKFAPYVPFDTTDQGFDDDLDAYLDALEPWGLSALRVPFSWAAMEPEPGTDDEAWLLRYDALLDGAADRGLWTIVDFHQDIYGEWWCGDGFPAWTVEGAQGEEPRHDCEDWFFEYVSNDEVKAAFDAFWSDSTGVRTAFGQMWDRVAARHADRAGVIGYEVINEPGWGTADTAEWAPGVLAPFYAEMAARLQATDPDALVFFDSTGLDAVQATTDLVRPDGDNLVFAPHFYDLSVLAGGDLTGIDVAEGIARWADKGREWDVPVLLGEFGVDAALDGAGPYADAHYDALDDLGMSATWWEYSASVERWNHEDLSLVSTEGEDQDVVLDAVVRPYPAALASMDAGEWTWDGEVFSLSYSPVDGGVTEVVLPARIFPGEVAVTGEGACTSKEGGRLYLLALGDGGVEVRVAGR